MKSPPTVNIVIHALSSLIQKSSLAKGIGIDRTKKENFTTCTDSFIVQAEKCGSCNICSADSPPPSPLPPKTSKWGEEFGNFSTAFLTSLFTVKISIEPGDKRLN